MDDDRQAAAMALGRAMQAYQRSTQAFDDEVGRLLGLNPTDLRGLDWLTEGPLTASRLAEAAGLSAAATTAMIDRLEAKGYVRRIRDQADRRRVVVEMTDAGQARSWAFYGPLVEEGMTQFSGFETAELARMCDQLVAMRELTDRHRDRLKATPGG